MSYSLWPHEQQHPRPTYPSPTARVYPNPCLSSWWCHLTISSSVVPFSSCPQSFPASGFFQMSQLFESGKIPKYWNFSLSTVLPMNTHPGMVSFRMDWLDLLAVQGTLKSFLQHHSSKASILRCSAFFFFFNFNFYFILLYNTVLLLPYIDMNPPWVYMSSQTWTPLPPPSP